MKVDDEGDFMVCYVMIRARNGFVCKAKLQERGNAIISSDFCRQFDWLAMFQVPDEETRGRETR